MRVLLYAFKVLRIFSRRTSGRQKPPGGRKGNRRPTWTAAMRHLLAPWGGSARLQRRSSLNDPGAGRMMMTGCSTPMGPERAITNFVIDSLVRLAGRKVPMNLGVLGRSEQLELVLAPMVVG